MIIRHSWSKWSKCYITQCSSAFLALPGLLDLYHLSLKPPHGPMYSTVPSVAMSSDVLIVLLLLSEYSQCLNSVCKFTLCFLLTMHAIGPANSSNIKLQVCGGGKLTNSIGHIYLLNQLNCKKKKIL